ncbi:MAG TPA: HAD family phosphatase [Novosphingobium sp.]|nr:HAD family phosphatase [Novosphingobium sp.]
MTQFPQPAAVIFDMDGLIFDTETLYRRALQSLARDRDLAAIDEDFCNATVGRPWLGTRALLAQRLGGTAQADAFRIDWLDTYHALTESELTLKIGVLELLARLDELGIARAIATGSERALAHGYLAGHGLLDRFAAIVAAEDYTKGKPAPEPFLQAAQALGVAPENCWALEDSPNGVHAAHAAGMVTIMVPDLIAPSAEIAAKCHMVAPDLLAVRALLAPST